jgi:hypothetical protein
MPKKFILPALCFMAIFMVSNAFAQKYSVKDYPEGLYYSYEDFVNKKVRPSVKMERHTFRGNKVIDKDVVEDHVFFYRVKDTSKVEDIFAISYQGNLYFKQRQMTKHAKKGDRDESGSNPNLYHRVLKDGNFFYMEGMFGNAWVKGLAYGGGVVGGAVAASENQLTGVIYDFSANEFDFFRNCKDFNVFLKSKGFPELDCKTNRDIERGTLKVREIIDQLISQ